MLLKSKRICSIMLSVFMMFSIIPMNLIHAYAMESVSHSTNEVTQNISTSAEIALPSSTTVLDKEIMAMDSDTTPPAFAPGYPKMGGAQSVGSRQIRVIIIAQEAAYYYFVVLTDNAPAPTKEQVIAGKDANGNAALKAENSGGQKYTSIDTGTIVQDHDTAYDVYVVLRDDAGNLSEPAKVDVTSPVAADFLAPGYPQTGDIQAAGSRQVQVKVKLLNTERNGMVYWVLLPDNAPVPTIGQIRDGKDGAGIAAITSDSHEYAVGIEEHFLVTGIADNTAYDLYMVVGDTYYASPLACCTEVMKLEVITPIAAPAGSEPFEVNGTKYDTLNSALSAVSSGGTIKLLKNYTSVQSSMIDNKNVTIDLNGYNLSITTTENEGLKVIRGTVALTGNGAFDVSGRLYGVWAGSGSRVTVTNATATDTGSSGIGVYAISGSEVTVRKDVRGAVHGVRAENMNTKVTVNGNVSSTAQITGAVHSAGQANVVVMGNVVSTMGYGVNTYGGSITVEGNVYALRVGAMTEDISDVIIIKGDISCYNYGAIVSSGNGSITVNGEIKNTNTYLRIGSKDIDKAAGIPDPGKPGYLKYSESGVPGAIWVKYTVPTVEVGNAIELENALTSIPSGGVIRLTSNIDYNKEIVINGKTITFDVGNFQLNVINSTGYTSGGGLDVRNGGHVGLIGSGQFNVTHIGMSGSVGVYVGENSSATVTNVKAVSGVGSGVYASGDGAIIHALGNIEVVGSSGYGVKTWAGGQITIDGTVTSRYYISISTDVLGKEDGVLDPGKAGYLKYSSQNEKGIVWIKNAPPIVDKVCEIEGIQYDNLDAALNSIQVGETKTISLLKSMNYNKGISLDNKKITFNLNGYTLNITNSANDAAGLDVYNGGSVTLSGAGSLNVTGTAYGVIVASNSAPSSVTVTNATATAPDGKAAYAYNKASITVTGDVRATGIRGFGAHALDSALININGNVNATEQGICASDATIRVEGNVQANGMDILGNASGIGVNVYDGTAVIGGNVTANRIAVMMRAGGTITIDGILTAPDYIQFNDDAAKTIADYVTPTTKSGYRTYKTGSNTVWIKGEVQPITYALIVENGTGDGSYGEGTQVTITADAAPQGKIFDKWMTSGGGTFANAGNATTTFTMPAKAVTVTATYKNTKPGGNPGGNNNPGGATSGGASSGDSTSVISTKEKKPNQPVIGNVEASSNIDKNGNATVTVSAQMVTDATNKAATEAKKQDKAENGIGMSILLNNMASTKSLSIVLPQFILKQLMASKVQQFEVNGQIISLKLDLETLKELQKQSTGDVTIVLKSVKADGVRSAYDIAISYVRDGKTIYVTSLGKGNLIFSIPYTPGKKEAIGYLFAVYLDGKGKVTRISNSAYDRNRKSIIFTTNYFGVFDIGYLTPMVVLTDITNHWAKESIDYVMSRSLMEGITDTNFEPDTVISRRVLVTALARLADADVSSYKTSSFTDVAKDKYDLPYIEWAYKKNIIQGVGNGQFAPDRAITREEIAAILTNYAKAIGYQLPVTREVIIFADNSSISSTYVDAVKAMQQAGIMMGENNNKFNPKAYVTRAEFTAMLHHLIKLRIDPATAQGWAQNDDGRWFFYKDGKLLTGWQTIDGLKYSFTTSGTLQEGWVKDNNNWYFFTGNNRHIGWMKFDNKRYYFGKDGVMVIDQWLKIRGKWYYFFENGTLAVSTKIDGYMVDDNGVRKTK